MSEKRPVEFGAALRKEFFFDEFIPLCQGSYGSIPRSIQQQRFSLLNEAESEPDHFYRRTLLPRWKENLRAVCAFLKLDYKKTTFVNNVTTGMNAIMKCLDLKSGDVILVNSSTYPAVYQTCKYMQKTGAVVVSVDLTPPIDSIEDVLSRYKKAIDKHSPIKVAVIDAISSPTATRFPVKELVALCKSHGIITAIDGAHVPGQLDLDIEAIAPDFYTGNLHKWLFVPRSCAVLWVGSQFSDRIVPNVVSTYHTRGFHIEFFWQGTLDMSQNLCVKHSIQFYERLGGMDAIHKYVCSLLDEAVSYLTELWGTDKYAIPVEMEAPYLRNVRLPSLDNYPLPKLTHELAYDDQMSLQTDLYEKFHIATMPLIIHGGSYIRLSGAVYNTMDDYKKLGSAILQLRDGNSQKKLQLENVHY